MEKNASRSALLPRHHPRPPTPFLNPLSSTLIFMTLPQHPLHLRPHPRVLHQEALLPEHYLQRLSHLFETRLGALLLREARESEVGFAAVREDGEEFAREGDGFDGERCWRARLVGPDGCQFRREKGKHGLFFSPTRAHTLPATLSTATSLMPYFLHSLKSIVTSFRALTFETWKHSTFVAGLMCKNLASQFWCCGCIPLVVACGGSLDALESL